MGRRHEDGDGYTSEDRNLLRIVAGYAGAAPAAADIARSLGVTRQKTVGMVAVLASGGLLAEARPERGAATYSLTDAGRRELEDHAAGYLLVKVDDRLAAEVAYHLERNVGGILEVTWHGGGEGCCCPHGGKCR